MIVLWAALMGARGAISEDGVRNLLPPPSLGQCLIWIDPAHQRVCRQSSVCIFRSLQRGILAALILPVFKFREKSKDFLGGRDLKPEASQGSAAAPSLCARAGGPAWSQGFRNQGALVHL